MDINVYKYDRYFLGSMIGGLIGLVGNAQQSSNIDKQLNSQKQENEENRNYNYMLAQKQNEWNIEQWNRENEYNLPANQIKRYMDAGLNPDLIYQQSNISAQSPQMTSGAPSTPVDMSSLGQKPTIDRALSQALNVSSVVSTVKKNISDSNKSTAETKILTKEFEWFDINSHTQIEKERSVIYLNNTYSDLNKEQKEYVKKSIDFCDKQMSQIDQNISESKSRQGLLDEQKISESVKRACTEEMKNWYIAQTGFSEAQTRDILEYLPTKIALGQSVVVKTGHESYLIAQEGTNMYIRNLTQNAEDQARISTIKSQGNLFDLSAKGQSIDNSWKNINYTLAGVNSVWQNINGTLNAQANALNAIGEIVPF